ncbi:MAG: ParA family protein [Calditerrivibrio sp.]|nr:ParA family protein [Calditerrivibrio sp.]MCA1932026.1 ParA family protein [Calditerrivibrio sp.]MCA1979932.1 ParA family protein [Calditerrivibrio sp.]
MKIVALYNVKGGVGKTSSSVNLAYLSGMDGYKTVLWDLDPQGAATFYLNSMDKMKGNIKKIITDKDFYEKNIQNTDYPNLKLLPSDIDLRNIDLLFNEIKKSGKKFRESVKDGFENFDVVFIDCPPGISTLSENIIDVIDLILTPLIPSPLSFRTYELLIGFSENKPIKAFFTMVDKRKKLHKEIISTYLNENHFLKTYIPYSSKIEMMGIEKKPLPEYEKKSEATESYFMLWQEVKKLLKI